MFDSKLKFVYISVERRCKMPIVDSVYKCKSLFASEFFCPNCLVIRTYKIKPMAKDMTFYPISFLEPNEANHAIECQVCKKLFDPDILNRNNQSLFKLAGAAKSQLDHGITPGAIKLRLMSDGLNEPFVDSLLTLAQH